MWDQTLRPRTLTYTWFLMLAAANGGGGTRREGMYTALHHLLHTCTGDVIVLSNREESVGSVLKPDFYILTADENPDNPGNAVNQFHASTYQAAR